MKNFENKNVLITGGASGIGKIMGRILLEKGANLIIWDINEAGCKQVEYEFKHLGKVSYYVVDISDRDDIDKVAEQTLADHKIVDLLINNAGIVFGKYFHEHKTQDIIKTMSINAEAPMLVTSKFLPSMMQQDSGHICNIASSAGLISNPRMSVYAASKWAVVGWSDSLRLEMKKLKSKVGVTTVTPYYINTGMFDGVKSVIPILKPEYAAKKIINGIEKSKIYVSMPWSVWFVRLGQGLMPIWFFDWFIGGVMGIYKGMDEFTGRVIKK